LNCFHRPSAFVRNRTNDRAASQHKAIVNRSPSARPLPAPTEPEANFLPVRKGAGVIGDGETLRCLPPIVDDPHKPLAIHANHFHRRACFVYIFN
jgi:hypothetical protein